MIRVLLILILTLTFNIGFSQTAVCNNELDSAGVVRIAKWRNSYWTKSWQYLPGIQYDEQNCEWIVQSCKSRCTNKGKCKRYNGCTIVKSVRLIIDAKNGKVKDRTKEKNMYFNYE